MRRTRLTRILLTATCCLVLLASTVSATVLVLFNAYVPLLDPQGGVRVEKVLFRSLYAQPESTISAAVWPYRINGGPGEPAGQNINPANILGMRIDCGDLKTGGQVTVDLSGMKDLPTSVRRQWPQLSRADVLKALIVATDRNLKLAELYDCRLVVKGLAKQQDLSGMRLPPVLNPRPVKKERAVPTAADSNGNQ